VVSWGNLAIASQKADLKAEDLNGADITLFGENTINASVVLYTLKENGIEPANVQYLAGAAETQALLLSDAEAIVVTAEPALTAAKMKNSAISSIAVNELLKAASGEDGYTQAGLFVKAETLEAQPEGSLRQVRNGCGSGGGSGRYDGNPAQRQGGGRGDPRMRDPFRGGEGREGTDRKDRGDRSGPVRRRSARG
jgi:hypothetical protein